MYSRFCDATALPLLADADTGFGNVTNVARAVRLYEKAGVAGLFIEDQVFPKRCGHMAGKAVVPPPTGSRRSRPRSTRATIPTS